jgi:hypothetical protein
VDQEAVGEPPTGFETPGRVIAQGETEGAQLGASRAEKDQAVGEGSGAMQVITGASRARKGVLSVESLTRLLRAQQRVATKLPRRAVGAARVAAVERRLRRREDRLPDAKRKVEDQERVRGEARQRFAELPRHLKGYFGSPFIPYGIELAVVIFDGGALHGALGRAGFSTASVWYMSVAIPLLILAVNHALGVLAGAIGARLSAGSHLKVAAGVFVASFSVLVAALVMLTVFRAEATTGQNAALASWAAGHLNVSPSFLISPIWLGPAQLAGSIAAIVTVAFWTMAQEGRELKDDIKAAERLLASHEGELAGVERDIEGAHGERDGLLVDIKGAEVDAAEAKTEAAAHKTIHTAELDAEDGLAEAARGRLRSSYLYTEQIYGNGNVVRVALATVRRWGRRFTPPPGDSEGQPYRGDPGRNGHIQITPDEMRRLVED